MEEKKTRFIYTFISLDKNRTSSSLVTWNKNDYENFIQSEEKHYGLKVISSKEEILINIEYTNIIWNYKIYYSSYKKKYKPLTKDDERWSKIEKQISTDLKMIGLESLKQEIITNLKNNQYYEYKTKKEEQFKKYCI